MITTIMAHPKCLKWDADAKNYVPVSDEEQAAIEDRLKVAVAKYIEDTLRDAMKRMASDEALRIFNGRLE